MKNDLVSSIVKRLTLEQLDTALIHNVYLRVDDVWYEYLGNSMMKSALTGAVTDITMSKVSALSIGLPKSTPKPELSTAATQAAKVLAASSQILAESTIEKKPLKAGLFGKL